MEDIRLPHTMNCPVLREEATGSGKTKVISLRLPGSFECGEGADGLPRVCQDILLLAPT